MRIRWPAKLELVVIAIPLDNVPALSKAGRAGVSTDGSKVTCRSYEIIPSPVTSPTVIGIVTTDPDKAPASSGIITGTGTPCPIGVAVEVAVDVAVFVAVGVNVDVLVCVGVNVAVAVLVGV